MSANVLTVAYLTSGVLFVLALGGLSQQSTARRGNLYGLIGMALAIVATLANPSMASWGLAAGGVLVGALIGAVLAKRVAMTAMPELVAILHSFVGLAAVLVGISSYLAPGHPLHGAEELVHLVEIWIGVAIGAVTFTGSIVAWAKLRGTLGGSPMLLPGRHLLNGVAALAVVVALVPFLQDASVTEGATSLGIGLLVGLTVVSSLLGMHLVLAIGGADMPVVVSLLNSYSGWAAAAAGFMLGNDLLIITGALVGSSGAILSTIMCRAMNRSIWNVVFGGFGATPKKSSAVVATPEGEVISVTAEEVSELASNAKKVMIIPGYGMAVARAQHLVHEFAKGLKKKGVDVSFVIHPVAGRLPGHMNVLLAEAGVPYDIVFEMDEVNHECAQADLILVIGANDIVNPSADTDEGSPIYGMPVIHAWDAKRVVVLKRGMSSGYAGVENPLFFHPNTRMLFGDATASMQALAAAQL
jgi:H+-translocating NAD(P) transhydrogenase subunit beta